jgi:hypothetical protein
VYYGEWWSEFAQVSVDFHPVVFRQFSEDLVVAGCYLQGHQSCEQKYQSAHHIVLQRVN